MASKTIKKPKPALNGKPLASPAEVMTLAEAAAFLRVPEDGLKADAVKGRVPGRLVAGEWRFTKATLLAWFNEPETAAPKKSSKERMRALIGAWKDDPTVDAMVEEIYRKRKANMVGEE